MPKVFVIYGDGIGCHKEASHAYDAAYGKVGSISEIVHYRRFLLGQKNIFDAGAINFSGGFWAGDMLGAGMCGANEISNLLVTDDGKRLKDLLVEFAEKGGIIYGQCNGFQLLVKTGLLPGINGDYSRQTLTLTNNDCGSYRVDFVAHKIEKPHWMFEGIDLEDMLWLWCRHGEGKIQFWSPYGQVKKAEAEKTRADVNENHVLLRYADRKTEKPTERFPDNPNGSVDAIAGLTNTTGTIIGHMAHTEVSIYLSRHPEFFNMLDAWRRKGLPLDIINTRMLEGACIEVFRNIVKRIG